jgi:hypothetical protein
MCEEKTDSMHHFYLVEYNRILSLRDDKIKEKLPPAM